MRRNLFLFTVILSCGTLLAAPTPTFPASFVTRETKFARKGVAPLKTRIIFTVCHIALYLPPDVEKADVFSPETPKALEFFYHHAITGAQFGQSAEAPLAANLSAADMAAIRGDIAAINRLYRDVKPGDRYRLVYVPGSGTELLLNGKPLGTIDNPAFPGLYLRIWLGTKPIDEKTRDTLLSSKEVAMKEDDRGGTPEIYGFSAVNGEGETVSLSAYRGKVLLIVNTASKCGFTPQYEGLQALHETYADRGLAVLGFPCNQFGSQEPGTNEEIRSFCTLNYGVTFPMFAKIDVNGDDAHPLFSYLRQEAPGLLGSTGIKWNFTKFLVSRDGRRITRYGSSKAPADLAKEIEKLLSE